MSNNLNNMDSDNIANNIKNSINIQSQIDKLNNSEFLINNNCEIYSITDIISRNDINGIKSNRYIVSLVCGSNNANKYRTYKIDLSKIGVILVSKQVIDDILDTFGIEYIRNVTENEWIEQLQYNFNQYLWIVIKQIIINYYDQLKYSQPNVFAYKQGTAIFEIELCSFDFNK